jgi:hypothetical protein
MTVSLIGFNPDLVNLIQQNVLERTFQEALFPRLLFRSELRAERWADHDGETKTFTRAGVMPIKTKPLVPGQDPTPNTYGTEQYTISAAQYGDRVQTHMPTSRVAIASKFVLDAQKLGENAGMTLNRLVRNRLYRPYLQGDTVTIVAALSGAVNLRVASVNGFLERLLGSAVVPVSPLAPIDVELGVTNIKNTVIAQVPDSAADPYGPGTIVLGTALGANLAVRSRVRAVRRARILRVGGAATVDGLNASSLLTVQDVINAVQLMRANNVPPHPDGRYHVHTAVAGITQLYQDAKWQGLLNLANLDLGVYKDLVIAQGVGCFFYSNNETPNQVNSGTLVGTGATAYESPDIGAEVINENGIPIARTIVTGGGVASEFYVPEAEYDESGTTSMVSKVGNFNVTNAGVSINTDRVRYLINAPQDALRQVVDQVWSFTGDWAVPTDVLTGNGARVKRGVVIEHAGGD